jgi:ribosomal protein S18 acetylase RimI-like enzyme
LEAAVLFRRYSSQARREVRLIVEDDEAKVGWGRLEWWDEADGTRLYLLSGGVAVPRRRQGIGRALLARLEDEAAALWRSNPGRGAALLGGNAGPDEPETLALLTAAGYRIRFTLVDLARDPAGTQGGTELPPGVELRPVEPEQHPAIHAAIQVCFARAGLGTMTFPYEEYLADAGDLGLWLVAWDGQGVAGLVINEVLEPGVADTPWVAVLPRRRRQGLASALLRRNLTLLATHGIRDARIRTVQENPDNTVRLYESLGYRVTGHTPRYAKPLGG